MALAGGLLGVACAPVCRPQTPSLRCGVRFSINERGVVLVGAFVRVLVGEALGDKRVGSYSSQTVAPSRSWDAHALASGPKHWTGFCGLFVSGASIPMSRTDVDSP